MPFHIRTNSTWRQVSETPGTNHRIYTRVGGQWRVANEVWSRANGVWKKVYTRPPGNVSNVSLTVNGSSNSNITITSSPVTAVTTWQVPSTIDTGFPANVRYFLNNTWDGVDHNVVSGTRTHTNSISIAFGQSRSIFSTVRLLNGTLYGAAVGSNDIIATWATPQITNISMTPDYAFDYIFIQWTPTSAPAGATYVVSYRYNYGNWTSLNNPPGQSQTFAYLYTNPPYDLIQNFLGNSVTIGVEIMMFSGGSVVASAYQDTSYNIPDDQ